MKYLLFTLFLILIFIYIYYLYRKNSETSRRVFSSDTSSSYMEN